MSFDDTQLAPCESVKNLGDVLNSLLSFRSHIDSTAKTCNFHIRNLYMIKDFVNRKNLVTLVHSLAISKVDYCNSLFTGLPNVILKKVQSVLNRAARLIFNLPPRVPTTTSLTELHWLPLRARIELKICLIIFKSPKFNQPSYIRELLSFSSHESTLGLRSADDPYHLHESKAIGERGFANRSFSYIAPRLYNELPIIIKLIDSLNTFKSHLKAFLFSCAYDQSGVTVLEDYYCKFWCFCFSVSFTLRFSRGLVNFGSSEERALAAKQNPDLTIISDPRRGRYMVLKAFIFSLFFGAISLEPSLVETPN